MAWFVTAVWDWFFPVHMLVVGGIIIRAFYRKLEWAPQQRFCLGCEAGYGALNMLVIEGLLAYGLMSSDHLACGADWALPQMHAMGQIVSALALYTSAVLSAYLRLQEKRVPADIEYYLGCLPAAVRVEKERAQ